MASLNNNNEFASVNVYNHYVEYISYKACKQTMKHKSNSASVYAYWEHDKAIEQHFY